MLYYLAELLSPHFGPFRLFSSHLLLLGFGAVTSALAVWWLLPKLFATMPRDRGKTVCADLGGLASAGKPTGAGFAITLVILPVILLFAPLAFWDVLALLGLYAAMLFGYLDDRAEKPWGELRKGLLDLAVAVAVAYCLARGHSTLVWLPLVKGMWAMPMWAYLPMAVFVLWFTMNAVNCSDGVDGLAGSLTLIALAGLAVVLYAVIGYRPIAHYFLLPCNPEAARWAIVVMAVAGGFAGYLWYNANPSAVLMGDAGSRFLGLLIAMAALVAGNPFLVLAFAPVMLVNGGGGLGKLVLLRLAKRLGFAIGDDSVIRRVRFPLHDHCKKNLKWTNAQVLMRFVLLQLAVMPLILLVLLKVR